MGSVMPCGSGFFSRSPSGPGRGGSAVALELSDAMVWMPPARLPALLRATIGRSLDPWSTAACQAALSSRLSIPPQALSPTNTLACRIIGQSGLKEAFALLRRLEGTSDPHIRQWCDWSTVLLGGRGEALNRLLEGVTDQDCEAIVLELALSAGSLAQGREILHALSRNSNARRRLISAIAAVGDPGYLDWLVGLMEVRSFARIAAEAFSKVTGADLPLLDLDRPPEEGRSPQLDDDPDSDSVEMDPDDGLPWPDPVKVAAWWDSSRHLFPIGERFFMGARPTPKHCLDVLRQGLQRQRRASAVWQCVLSPGISYFQTTAPAWRQQRWLAQLQASE